MVLAHVATVPTVYGIETSISNSFIQATSKLQQYLPFTVLKRINNSFRRNRNKCCALQQYLPFTVLKLQGLQWFRRSQSLELQQYLPFTVLKLSNNSSTSLQDSSVATVPTVYGIETMSILRT